MLAFYKVRIFLAEILKSSGHFFSLLGMSTRHHTMYKLR